MHKPLLIYIMVLCLLAHNAWGGNHLGSYENLFSSGKCQAKSKQIECTGKLYKHSYPQDVTVYFPLALDNQSPIKLNIFLHGHRTPGKSWYSDVAGRFQFEKPLSKIADKSLITILPHSRGKNTDHKLYFSETDSNGKLKSASKFENFLMEFFDLLETNNLCNDCALRDHRVILSGHSGAYTALFGILASEANKKSLITNINFIDSMYTTYPARYKHLKNFILNHPLSKARVLSLQSTRKTTKKMERTFLNDSSLKDLISSSVENIPTPCYNKRVCFHYPDNFGLTHSSIVNKSFYWLSILK